MHELSVAQNIVEIVDEVLQAHPASKIDRIVVDIGELAAVVPETLTFCFGVITEKTNLAKTRLEINHIPLTVDCRKCCKVYEISPLHFYCPDCGNTDVIERSGREFDIKYIECL